MPCGPSCACLGTGVECLSVVAPARFGYFKGLCESGDPIKRMHVLNRSRIGIRPPEPSAPAEDAGHAPSQPPPSLVAKAVNPGKAIVTHVAAGIPESGGASPPIDPAQSVLDSIPLAGDVVEAIARKIGADRLAKLWERWTGVPCGCPDRREKLNRASEKLKRWAKRLGVGKAAES